MGKLNKAKEFTILAVEPTDISNKEQMSDCMSVIFTKKQFEKISYNLSKFTTCLEMDYLMLY